MKRGWCSFGPLLALVFFVLVPACGAQSNKSSDLAGGDLDLGSAQAVEGSTLAFEEVGAPCKADSSCKSRICFAGACAKPCTRLSDCAGDQDCGSDDGKRAFCYGRTYTGKGIGASCAITNTCPKANMYCLGPGGGSAENGDAYCTIECSSDVDCPPDYTCFKKSGQQLCTQRTFCSRCVHDGQCRDGGRCLLQGKEKFCTRACHQGSTECPRFAKCVDAGGDFQCEHKSGTCAGNGSLCQPCTVGQDCALGGLCLTYSTKETFCGSSCSSASCPADYTCQAVGADKQCVPSSSDPSCVALSPTMEVGDIMDDFAMVGYADSNGDGSLEGEALKVIRLSDYANDPSVKVILFAVAAGWCAPCQNETKLFAGLLSAYGPKGMAIVQTLFDTDKQGEPATVSFLKSWIKALKPAGACGIDPAGNSLPLNTAGTTPLNLIIDAKTRKVLSKFNTAIWIDPEIKKALGL